MLEPPKCYLRKCKHLIGVKNDGDEMTERVVCEAFPDRIPHEIAYGDHRHSTVYPSQKNDIVFERRNHGT